MSRPDLWAHLSILNFFFPKEKVLLGCETLKSLPSLENQAPSVKSPHPHRHVTGKKTGWEVLRSSPSYLLSTPGKLLRISESYTKGCFRVLWFQPAQTFQAKSGKQKFSGTEQEAQHGRVRGPDLVMGEGESNLAFLRSWGHQTVCWNKADLD